MKPIVSPTSRLSLRKRRAVFNSDQSDLFQRLEQPARPSATSLDIGPELLGAINTALRQARTQGLSRDRIVDRMNDLLPDVDKPITKRKLDCWTATSAEFHHFPAEYLPAFCRAVDCDLPPRTPGVFYTATLARFVWARSIRLPLEGKLSDKAK